MIQGRQIRAARALLGWTQAELAKAAGVSQASVQRAEATNGVPNIRAPVLLAIETALARAGIEFVDNGIGVRLRNTLSTDC
jgi:transcriptional regulator with XRE-family HTH domain